jgi:hypothetical protein
MSKELLYDLVDRIRHTILSAPDDYSEETDMNLEKSFNEIIRLIEGSARLLADKKNEVDALAKASLEACQEDDMREGIRCLQQIESIIREIDKKL